MTNFGIDNAVASDCEEGIIPFLSGNQEK